MQPRIQRWLKKGLIPLRTLTLVAGVGGLGKSMWLAAVAAAVITGELLGEPADVIIVSFEDPAAEVLRPRVEAAGGDLDPRARSSSPRPRRRSSRCGCRATSASWSSSSAARGAKLLVIDPIVAAIDVELDAHKDQHVRAVLAQLAELAEEARLRGRARRAT